MISNQLGVFSGEGALALALSASGLMPDAHRGCHVVATHLARGIIAAFAVVWLFAVTK